MCDFEVDYEKTYIINYLKKSILSLIQSYKITLP